MAQYNDGYKYMTESAAVFEKTWAAGSKQQVEYKDYIEDTTARYAPVMFPPAMTKIVDEPIVNAVDHAVNMSKLSPSHKVTLIDVKFAADGTIRVYNDGPGINIRQVAAGTETYWLPELFFGKLHQGGNHSNPNSVTGGTNGLGGKVTNCFSEWFTVHTCQDGKCFVKRWEKCMSTVPQTIDVCGSVLANPTVLTTEQYHDAVPALPNDLKVPHTMLRFKPMYTEFGYKNIPVEFSWWIRARLRFAAAFLKYLGIDCKIMFNNAIIECSSPTAHFYAPHIAAATPVSGTTRHIECYVYANPRPWLIRVYQSVRESFTSIINGVVVGNGSHKLWLRQSVTAAVTDAIGDKTIKPRTIFAWFACEIICQIPSPGWSGQRKDDLVLAASKLPDGIPNILADWFIAHTLARITKPQKVVMQKYKPARLAGSAQSSKCKLVLGEGDSALAQITNGLASQRRPEYSTDYVGFLSTGGVIINAQRQMDGQSYGTITKKMNDNKFFATFAEAIGLPWRKCTNIDVGTLKYGRVIICVDQDHDGQGNIFGLFLDMVNTLWPSLLDPGTGFVYWYCTPLIRCYPRNGGKILCFYDEPAFTRWRESTYGTGYSSMGACTRGYDVKYYKGLATHSDDERDHMFRDPETHMYVYENDGESQQYFKIYFGVSPDARKIELSKPYTDQFEIPHELKMTTSVHMKHITRAFQIDNIERKLCSAIDGQNQVGRKVLDYLLGADNKLRNVEQIAGAVSETGHYHHGPASLTDAITRKGYIAPGATQIPFLIPDSIFGSRLLGTEGVKPRYIKAYPHKQFLNAIFPPADYPVLVPQTIDGEIAEPAWFAPIIPMAVMENIQMPAHGWKIAVWARDVTAVINRVRDLIRGYTPGGASTSAGILAAATHGWTGQVLIDQAGRELSCGRCVISGSLLKITELPLGVWTQPHKEKLLAGAADHIVDVRDNSSDKQIDISVNFVSDRTKLIADMTARKTKYPIEAYEAVLGRRPSADEAAMIKRAGIIKRMNHDLNMIGSDKSVVNFSSYDDVVRYWFGFRRKTYFDRVRRQLVLTQLRIELLKNQLAFIVDQITLTDITRDAMIQILTDRGYKMLDKSVIVSPERRSATEIAVDAQTTNREIGYKYLLELSSLHRTEEHKQKLLAELEKENTALLQYRAHRAEQPVCASVWLAELDKLESIIEAGRRTRYKYGDQYKYSFD